MQKLGFIFPGQGSQKIGMLKNLILDSNVVQDTFSEASEVLGKDLWEIVQLDTASNLDKTEITQPALLTASTAIWRVWNDKNGPRPSVVVGHSLGEYSALVCAGVISFQDAVNLVFRRGQYMQLAVSGGIGKMAAIVGLGTQKVEEICKEAEETDVLSAANFNTPEQTVIAGNVDAVDRAIALSKKEGAKRALPLNVSIPAHCDLMKPAAENLEKELSKIKFNRPKIAVIQNVDALINDDPEKIKRNLVKQLYSPVLWVNCVKLINKKQIKNLVECGPGKVLSGLIKRIEPKITCHGSDDAISLAKAIEEVSV